jgi:hypothetical protein
VRAAQIALSVHLPNPKAEPQWRAHGLLDPSTRGTAEVVPSAVVKTRGAMNEATDDARGESGETRRHDDSESSKKRRLDVPTFPPCISKSSWHMAHGIMACVMA